MASTASLPEPHVLAHAKRRLFPDADDADSYAVTDTQFGAEEWLPGQQVPAAIRERLAPFNHVRVGTGYPDLVGVRQFGAELLAVERFGEQPPLVAVEAKGDTGTGTVDVERGIVQAYDRLHEANAAYVAVPADAVSQTDRTLARELNVGVLGVVADGTVDPVEVPRVVGAVRDARRGAAFLGLVEQRPDRVALTPLGGEVVRFALDRHGDVDAALGVFAGWKRSRKRFCDLAPEWGLVARRVVWQYPATRLLVEELQAMHEDGVREPTLVELVERLHVHHPTFTVELFVRGTDGARERVLDGEGELRRKALEDGEVYHSPVVFQLKAILFHAGLLAERGAEPHRLDPTADAWTLREPLAV